MTPVSRCLHKVDHASAVTDSTVVAHVADALSELEAAYRSPSEKIVALEQILQEVDRTRRLGGSPFGRFLRVSVERRQLRWSRATA
jgi:hypothetical protein